MKYVKIKSATYNEAIMKLRMDYGNDAIPVSHKNIKDGGIMNSKLFAKNMVELTAAIPEKRISKSPAVKKNNIDITLDDNSFKKDTHVSDYASSGKNEEKPQLSSINRNPVRLRDNSLQVKTAPETEINYKTDAATYAEASDFTKLQKELAEIKNSLKTVLESGDYINRTSNKKITDDDNQMKFYYDILNQNDFNESETEKIIDKLKNSISKEDMKDKLKIEKNLKDLLKSKILTGGPIKKSIRKKVIMFIGPTGVGKTTTMAKLGAIYALREGCKVSFITIDTYRIAATEQLKKYANIMKIPIHVVNDQDDFKEVIEKENAEIIMVDTSGRSHRNAVKISEIKSFADKVDYDVEKILCISANTKKRDIEDVFNSFGKLDFNSVIVTKVDETSYIGGVIDVSDKYKKPISYITNGQEVPNDIIIAESGKLVDMIVNGTELN